MSEGRKEKRKKNTRKTTDGKSWKAKFWLTRQGYNISSMGTVVPEGSVQSEYRKVN